VDDHFEVDVPLYVVLTVPETCCSFYPLCWQSWAQWPAIRIIWATARLLRRKRTSIWTEWVEIIFRKKMCSCLLFVSRKSSTYVRILWEIWCLYFGTKVLFCGKDCRKWHAAVLKGET